jgi:hypothetical protein
MKGKISASQWNLYHCNAQDCFVSFKMVELLTHEIGWVKVAKLPDNIVGITLKECEELDVEDLMPVVAWVKTHALQIPDKLMLVGGYGSTISPDVQEFMAEPGRKDRVAA